MPAPTTPGAPTSVSAAVGAGQLTVSFTAPVSDGGAAISSYTVTATPSGGGADITATGSTSPITVTGLTNGTSYNITVTATNSAGTGSSGSAGWAINFGIGGTNTYIQATASDAAGNVYVAGYFSGVTLSVGGVTLTKIGAQDVFAVKYNAAGTVVWAKNFGGSGANAWGNALAVDSAGNVYLGGHFTASLTTPALTKIGNTDAFALKLDATGATTWAKNYGGPGARAYGNGIAVDSAGSVYLGGYFNSGNLTAPALTKIGTYDAFALKLSSTGATTWAKNYGGIGAQAYGYGVAVDSAGSVYLAGNFNSGNLTTPAVTKIGTWDAFALKLNATGATTWVKNYGGSGAEAYGRGIAVDSTGSVYLGGYFNGTSLTTPALTIIGTQDAFALKLSSTGATTWAKNYGGSGANVQGNGLAVDSAGSVYLSGIFDSASLTTPTLTKIGAQDAFALKLDATGATAWAQNYGGSGAYAYGNGIAVDTAGSVYLGGGFSTASLTTPALTLIGALDALLIKASPGVTPITVPDAPTSVSATAGNTQATVTFLAPASTGGSAITGYTVTSLPSGGTDTNAGTTGLSHVITGLTNGTSYTFTVTATNSVGAGSASSASSAVTPATTPGAPTGVSTTVGAGQLTVSFTAPVSNGGAAVSSYTVTATPVSGGAAVTATGSTSPITVTGLTNGTSYTISVAATNSAGTGAGSADWAINFSTGGSNTYIIATATDAAGNVYVTGYFSGVTLSVGGVTLTKIGLQDVFAVKYNAAGTVVWAKNYGGSGATAYGNGIAVDSAGSVYLGGYFTGTNLTTPALTKIGNVDAFALKLDATGATTWAKNYGGSGANAYGYAIAVDSAGSVYLGGYFASASLTAPALTIIGNYDAFALKLDATGATTWAKNYGGSGAFAYGNGIAVDSAGSVYLGGYFFAGSLTTPALTRFGVQDAFALKLDATGATTWAKNYGGSGANAYGRGIAVDSAGSVYLGGYFTVASLTTPALTKIGSYDAFALKLTATGATTWAKNYGGSGAAAYGKGIAVDSAGSVYLGGYFNGTSLTTPALTIIGTQDAYALKLDATGATTWAKNYSGSGATTQGYGLAVDSAGSVYLGGVFSGASLTTPALTLIGNADALLIKASPAVTPVAVPGAPTSASATAGNAQATVTFLAPASTGGTAITGYTVTSLPSGGTDSNAGTTGLSHIITGLTNGTSYTFTVTATNSVGAGSASTASAAVTPVTVPGAPTGASATAGNAQATVTFLAPASNGGAAITGYTVTSLPSGGTDSNAGTTGLSHIITGLTNGTSYTFTVKATNSVGAGSASTASAAVTPVTTPGAPTGVSTTVGAGQLTVSFTAPVNNGGAAVSSYTVTATPVSGGTAITATGSTSPITVIGLTNGTSYNITVTATNSAGTGSSGSADWARNYGTVGANTYIRATATDAAGNVYITGWFEGPTLSVGGVTLTRIGLQDVFAVKYNAAGTVAWAKNYGGSGAYAWGYGIAVDSAGNVYLGGYFQSASLTTPALTKIGSVDAFALKLDATGATTWAKNYGGSGATTQGYGIAVDSAGSVYLGGYFSAGSLTTPALTKIGTQDAFALKLDATGATTWAKNYGGSGASAFGNGIAVDSAGNVYLGGYFQIASLTTPALTKIGNVDAFALKLDATGATTWAKNYGGSNAAAYGYGIAVDSAGSVYLGGAFQNANLTTPALTKIGTYDAFALKLVSTGVTTWAKNYGGSGANVQGYGIAVDSAGSVYLGGYFSAGSLTTPALTKIGNYDAFALKLDATGATTLAKNYGGSGANVQDFAIAVDSAGSVYLGGVFSGASLTTPALTKIGASDALLIKASPAAMPIATPDAPTSVSATAGNTQATVTFLAPASTGGAAITGYTVTSLPSGGTDSNAGTTGLSHVITGLTNGTSYTFTVTATNSVGTGSASTASSAVTPVTTPGAPTSVSVAAGDSQLTVSFTAPGNTGGAAVSSYTVTATPSGGGTAITATGSTSPITVTGLTNGTSYTISVTATNSVGSGSGGSAGSSATPVTVPGAPTSASATAGNMQATVTFLAPASTGGAAITGYTVTSLPSGGTDSNAGTTGLSHVITGLTNGTSYTFTVTATNSVGTGSASTASSAVTPVTTPGAPTSVSVAAGDSQLTVSFTAPGNTGGAAVSSYTVTATPSGGGAAITATGSTSPITVTGLTNGTSYSISVTATNSVGSGSGSGSADLTTNFGTSGASTYIKATATDTAGNVYITGYFTGATLSVGGVTLTRIGVQDVFAVKYNATGTMAWAKNYGGSGASANGLGLAVDSAGNVYLSGQFSGASLTTPALTKIGSTDVFALKLDVTGATTWAKNYGGSGGANAYGNGIAVDSAGSVYLGGYFNSASLTTPALTKIGTADAFALKLTATGATTWVKNYGGFSATAVGNAIAVDSAGSVYLGGYFATFSLTTPALTKIGAADAFALKLDATGATTWAKNYGGSGASAQGLALAVDSAGSVYLSGYLSGASLTTPALTKIGNTDAFALKLDATGATTWAKNYGGSGATAYGRGIAVNSAGSVYLGGQFSGASLITPALTKIGNYDAFALMLDATGATVGARNYGGSGATASANGIAVDSAGSVYLGGYFGAASLTTPALTKIGTVDALLITAYSAGLVATPIASPDAPTSVSATAGNTQATVTFLAPASNGGAAITGYTVTSLPSGGTDSNAGTTGLSHVITGLTNGTSYTFTVTATNSVGTGSASTASSAVTPVTTPGAPTSVSVAAGDSQLTVSFTAPGNTGGAAVSSYTVTATPSGGGAAITATGSTSPITVTGLTNGTSYTISVTATNSVGSGSGGSAGSAVTPVTSGAGLSITSQPEGYSIPLGGSLTLTVLATGPNLTYQWKLNGNPVSDGNGISGATTAFLTLSNLQVANCGNYTVVVSSANVSLTSNTASVTALAADTGATHQVVSTSVGGYVAGQPITITNTMTYSGNASSLGWSALLPTGWSFVSAAGSAGDVGPHRGDTGELGWAWSSPPASPVTFTYTVNVPVGTTGAQAIEGIVLIRRSSDWIQTLAQSDPMLILPPYFHSADTDQGGQISLMEMLRVIELYNTHNGTTRTGAYIVQAGTEDGFAPDPTRSLGQSTTLSSYHSADEAHSGFITLFDFTRVIQLYNCHSGTTRTGQYRDQPVSEDGFAPRN